AQELGVDIERCADFVPVGLAAKDEVMQAAGEAKRRVPPRRRLDDRADAVVVGEPAPQRRVQRRPSVGLRGLVQKQLALRVAQASSADFAFSAIAANASGSDTARSA